MPAPAAAAAASPEQGNSPAPTEETATKKRAAVESDFSDHRRR